MDQVAYAEHDVFHAASLKDATSSRSDDSDHNELFAVDDKTVLPPPFYRRYTLPPLWETNKADKVVGEKRDQQSVAWIVPGEEDEDALFTGKQSPYQLLTFTKGPVV